MILYQQFVVMHQFLTVAMTSRSAAKLKAVDQARSKLEELTKYDYPCFTFMLTEEGPGKVLEGGPCTPFDPAPLGLALHETQGEELVYTPVFIQQV